MSVRFKGSPAAAASTSPARAVREVDDVPGWGVTPPRAAGLPPGSENPVPANPAVLISATGWGTTPPGTPSEYREVLALPRCTGLGDPGTGPTPTRAHEATNRPTTNPYVPRHLPRHRHASPGCSPAVGCGSGQRGAAAPHDLRHGSRRRTSSSVSRPAGGGWLL